MIRWLIIITLILIILYDVSSEDVSNFVQSMFCKGK